MMKVNVSDSINPTYANKHMPRNQVLENGLSRITYDPSRKISMPAMRLLPGPTASQADRSLTTKQHGIVDSVLNTINNLAMRKLSLGAKILQVGRAEKVFKRLFSTREGEELVKASKCCLSTSAGPVSGRLFISTDRLAFCSDKPIATFTCSSGESASFHYKVVIPLTKIKRASQCKSMIKSSQKYLQVVTTDDFEFWFMGFVNYRKTVKCLQQAVSKNA